MSSDDSQNSRRHFLANTLALAPLAAIAVGRTAQTPGESRTPPSDSPAPEHPTTTDYRPSYFTPAEWAFINAACDRLIPADDHGPGAIELGVPQYIDRQMGTAWADGAIWYMQGPFFEGSPEFGYQSQLTPKQQYRMGIRVIDALCEQRLGVAFAALTSAHQDEVLKQVEKGSLTSGELSLTTFFSGFLLKNVLEGYFCDPMYGGNRDMGSWKMISYPGARADYLEWVGGAKPYPYGPVSIYGKRG